MQLDEAFAPINETTKPNTDRNEIWRPVLPVPADAPQLTKALLSRFAPDRFSFTALWSYHDSEGSLLGCVVRYDEEVLSVSSVPRSGKLEKSHKEFRPLTYCEGPNGQHEWRCKAVHEPRPLYGLDRLAARPKAPVLITEGEKAADAAAKVFPDYVAVTSSGGSHGASKANWGAIAGRRVVIWPDHDEPGKRYADDVARLAMEAGAVTISIVEVPADVPAGWDLADKMPAGMDAASMLVAARSPDDWKTPIPIVSSLPPVEPFVPEMLPEALRGYVLDVADRQQSVPDFVAVAALCGIAAIIGNRIRIAPKQNDDWLVVPNLWGAIVGPPSAMKSPAMQSALNAVYGLEDEMRKTWQTVQNEARISEILAGMDAKEARKNASKALMDGDKETARAILADAQKDEDERFCQRIVVNDSTVEKLGELLNENPRGLLLIRDELAGFLARMEREEFAGERAFYLEAFNGTGRFTYDRIGRGTVHIANCTLSIVGGVQPSKIAPIVRGAITGTANDGLIQRFQLAVYPDCRPDWKWVDRPPDRAAHAAYEKVFRDLHDLPLGSPEEPAVLRFAPEPQELYRQWTTEIQTQARGGHLSPVLESHLLKMPKTVAILALIFELVDGGRFEVGERATLRALALADYLRSHANRLYSAGNTMIEDGARLILERRHQLPEQFTLRDIHRRAWAGLTDRDALALAIDLLIISHHLREIERPGASAGGRPTVSYRWNPMLGA